ncbi:hypothetical protein AB0N20_35810 [Streptomyces griseoincarnatus]
MDLEKSREEQAGEGRLVVALRMPVRIVALAWCGRGVFAVTSLLVAGIATALYWAARVLVVWPAAAVWRWVLAPVGRVLAVVVREAGAALGHAWWVAGYVSLAVGRVLAAFFRRTVVEPARLVYRTVLAPVGRAVRDRALWPVAEAARSVGRITLDTLRFACVTVRQVRQGVRRALLGDPETPGRQGIHDVRGSVGSSDGREDRTLPTHG